MFDRVLNPLKFFKIINIFTTESDQRHLALFYNLVLCKLFEVHKDTVMGRTANLAIAL